MTINFRIIWWIPVGIFFILNMFFKLIILILQNFGNGIVWCNRQIIKFGDYFTDKAKNDCVLDNFLKEIQIQKSIIQRNRKNNKRKNNGNRI